MLRHVLGVPGMSLKVCLSKMQERACGGVWLRVARRKSNSSAGIGSEPVASR